MSSMVITSNSYAFNYVAADDTNSVSLSAKATTGTNAPAAPSSKSLPCLGFTCAKPIQVLLLSIAHAYRFFGNSSWTRIFVPGRV